MVQTELAEKKKKRKKEKKKKRKLFLRKSFAKKNGDFLTNYGAADGCANIVLVCMVQHIMDNTYQTNKKFVRVVVEEGDHEQRQGPQAQGGVYVS